MQGLMGLSDWSSHRVVIVVSFLLGLLVAAPAAQGVPVQDLRFALDASPQLRDLVERQEPASGHELLEALASTRVTRECADGDSEPVEIRAIALLFREGRLEERVLGRETLRLEPCEETRVGRQWFPEEVFDLLSAAGGELFPEEVYVPPEAARTHPEWSPSAASMTVTDAPAAIVVAGVGADRSREGGGLWTPLVVDFGTHPGAADR